jgi:hypothetical protein
MGLRRTFSTTISDLDNNNVVYVESLNAFPAPVDNVITLLNKKYEVTKPIDSGIYQIKIPTNGDVQIVSNFEPENNWTTALTGNTPLFIGDLARLQIQDIDFISSTGTSNLFNIVAVTAARAVVVHQRSFVDNFASLGTIDGATSINTNVVYSDCGAGIILNDSGAALGAGIVWDVVNFINQTGDHITVTGSADFVSFNVIGGAPSTGDQILNLDSATVTGTTNIGAILFDDSNGGTTGLIKTYTSAQTLDNIFTDIRVDTTSGAVEIELPDTSASTFNEGYAIDITDTGNATTNPVNIVPNALDSTTINNGLTRYSITEDNGSVILQKHGDTWEIINRFNQKSILPTLTATSTLTEIDDVIIGDSTSGIFTTTLPTAVGRRGKFVNLKKLKGAPFTWTVTGSGIETIDGAANLLFTGANGPGATIMSDGVNWIIIEGV